MSRRAVVAAAVVAALAVGAVAFAQTVVRPSPTPSGSPASPSATATASQDASAVYETINDQVQQLRGLAEKKPVDPKLVSRAELGEVLKRAVEEDQPPELLAAYERLYKGMDLLDRDASLSAVYLDLLESVVAGLYDPQTESLYVLSKEGGVGPVERVFYSHEYDHALQDQHFDLEKMQEGLTDQTDRGLARQALIEGDAYVLMTYWLRDNLDAEEIGEVLRVSSDPEAQAALARIPEIVQAQILFAATQGTQWVLRLQGIGGWAAIDEIWRDPPESTEQILHVDKWESREPPVDVSIPEDVAGEMGEGWSIGLQDTFGEHQLGIWLGGASTEAAAGWGGDRAVLLDGPADAWGIALVSEWDTPADATEFADAAVARLDAAGSTGDVVHQPGRTRVTVLFASDDAAAVSLDRVFGHTGV